MHLSEHKELYKKAIEKWGVGSQLLMVFEEISELQLAICKSRRQLNPQTKAQEKLAIIDEIADVYIMLGQLLEIYNIYEMEVEHKVLVKIGRLETMLGVETKGGISIGHNESPTSPNYSTQHLNHINRKTLKHEYKKR